MRHELSPRRLLAEARRRGLLPDVSWEEDRAAALDGMLAELAPAQAAFIGDMSQFSAAYCTRQCGKTFTVVRDLLATALEAPDRICTYVNATHAEARRVVWDDPVDGLPATLRRHGLDRHAVLNITRMSVTFPNGSVVECMGMDSDGYAKIRGNKRNLIVVDEAQKARGLREAMSDLTYCLTARRGRLRLVGTPNRFCSGYFHDVCVGESPGWSVSRWGMWDIVGRPDIWESALETKARLGLDDDDPEWRREGLGEWVRTEAGLVCDVEGWGALHDGVPEVIVNSAGLSVPRTQPIRYLGGFDRGFSPDPAALVVVAYSMDEGVVYEVHSEELPLGASTDDQADAMARLARQFPGLRHFYCDDGTGQISEDWRRRHRETGADVTLSPARKLGHGGQGRMHMIDELRSDCRAHRTLVRRGSGLHDDLRRLSWDVDRWENETAEYASAPDPETGRKRSIDHRFDAFRYAWQEARHFLSEAPPAPESALDRQLAEVARDRAASLDPRRHDPRHARRTRRGRR